MHRAFKRIAFCRVILQIIKGNVQFTILFNFIPIKTLDECTHCEAFPTASGEETTTTFCIWFSFVKMVVVRKFYSSRIMWKDWISFLRKSTPSICQLKRMRLENILTPLICFCVVLLWLLSVPCNEKGRCQIAKKPIGLEHLAKDG